MPSSLLVRGNLVVNESSFQGECTLGALTAKRLRPPAQGCRFGYPGITSENDSSTATRLRHLHLFQIRRNRVAVGMEAFALPRVAEAATLGWRTQPLRGKKPTEGRLVW
jgi:hypothetical protein